MKEIIIITGGASGLGMELCEALSQKYFVCTIDRNSIGLNKIAIENKIKTFCGDISDESFIKTTVSEISKLGTIKAIINNAGAGIFKSPKENTKSILDELYKGVFGMILLTTNVLPHMETNGGKIINIMSSAALRGNASESAYCSMKWAERGYTESLKAAYKGTNILVMGVYPGGINTTFYNESRDYVSVEKQSQFMCAKDVAKIIIANAFADERLNVADLIIERVVV